MYMCAYTYTDTLIHIHPMIYTQMYTYIYIQTSYILHTTHTNIYNIYDTKRKMSIKHKQNTTLNTNNTQYTQCTKQQDMYNTYTVNRKG